LRHLSGLNKLTRLGLHYCNTSKAADEELRRQIPGLKIQHYRPGEDLHDDNWE
jgi:hypothetical protein